MTIESVRIQGMRSHADISLTIHPNTTIITGSNGIGKTTIAEAVYIALQGRSFRGVDRDILSVDADWYRIDMNFRGNKRIIKYEPKKQSTKTISINGKLCKRLSSDKKIPVVLFEPDDVRLLNGSPSRRRDFLDRMIGQYSEEYAKALLRYDKALKQRNLLLKSTSLKKEQLFTWNILLAKYGEVIYRYRHELINNINKTIEDEYNIIADRSDIISIEYVSQTSSFSSSTILKNIEKSSEKDILLGFTSFGPHRDDILILFNNKKIKDTASRGEMRTLLLSLKFSEASIIEDLLGVKPIVILDDVFGELDNKRQSMLVDNFKKHQTIITSVQPIPISIKKSSYIQLK